jgi:alkylation response protein AidB-like acyl-CoA dehydrogenase
MSGRLPARLEEDRVQFALSPEQTLLKDAMDAFVRDHMGTAKRRTDRAQSRGYSVDSWRSLADIGVLGLPFAAEDGGLGSGPRELVTVMESLGRGLCIEPVLEEIVVAGGLLARAGDAAQKQAWLPRVIGGEAHLALAHFEHTARFDLTDVRVRAHSSGGTAVLDGEKSMVPLAASADQWIVSARESGDEGDSAASIGFYLVAPTSLGIERRDFHLIDGSKASAVHFRSVKTGGRLRGGFREFSAAVDTARLAAGAEMVGLMSALYEATVEYLKTRQQFGRPLSSFQALQHRLADLYVRLEQSRSHLYRAMVCMATNEGAESTVAGMKSYISRAAIELGEECVHLHGGIGTTDELAIGHGYKRLVLLANLFGNANSELKRFNRLQNQRVGLSPPSDSLS